MNDPKPPAGSNPAPSGPLTPDQLVEEYMGFVTAIAKKILRGLPNFVELGDLESYGQIGLIEASRRFDPARGVQFKTFSYYRIRGAIYDGIRKMAWFEKDPDWDVNFQAASNEVLHESSESDSGAHGAMSLEDEISATRDTIMRIAGARLLSLDHENMAEIAADQESPEDAAAMASVIEIVRECLASLDEKERSVVENYYFRHMTLEEAGAQLGLSKSWTSRVHARALQNLGTLIRKRGLDSS